jgi:DNA-directed RNA polymerase beta subunit
MMERSDKYNYYVDDVSGDIAVANPQKGIMRSLSEPSSLEFSHIQTPFATKLMLQELESMSIMPRIITNDLEPSDNERSMEEYIGDLETIDEVNEQDDE